MSEDSDVYVFPRSSYTKPIKPFRLRLFGDTGMSEKTVEKDMKQPLIDELSQLIERAKIEHSKKDDTSLANTADEIVNKAQLLRGDRITFRALKIKD